MPVNEQYQIFFPKDVTYVNFHYLDSRTSYPIAGDTTYNGIDMKTARDISILLCLRVEIRFLRRL